MLSSEWPLFVNEADAESVSSSVTQSSTAYQGYQLWKASTDDYNGNFEDTEFTIHTQGVQTGNGQLIITHPMVTTSDLDASLEGSLTGEIDNDTITCNVSNATYQWKIDNNDIPGATNQTIDISTSVTIGTKPTNPIKHFWDNCENKGLNCDITVTGSFVDDSGAIVTTHTVNASRVHYSATDTIDVDTTFYPFSILNLDTSNDEVSITKNFTVKKGCEINISQDKGISFDECAIVNIIGADGQEVLINSQPADPNLASQFKGMCFTSSTAGVEQTHNFEYVNIYYTSHSAISIGSRLGHTSVPQVVKNLEHLILIMLHSPMSVSHVFVFLKRRTTLVA